MTETADRRFGAASSAEERRLRDHLKTYLLMFAVATAHELTHLFVAYLAQNSQLPGSYTPPDVSHLNYGRPATTTEMAVGESGRWLERHLFGGSIEYYRNRDGYDDPAFGVPHVVDVHALSRKISPDCVRRPVEHPRQFTFPFTTEGEALTSDDRQRLGVVSVGGSGPSVPLPLGRLLMRARDELFDFMAYNVPGSELRQVAISGQPIRRAQLVSA